MDESLSGFAKYIVLYGDPTNLMQYGTDDLTTALVVARDESGTVYIRGDVAAEG
jgi:hypothetical protein